MIKQTKTETQQPLLRLLQHTRHHRKTVLLATLYTVLNQIFDLAPPFLIGAAVDVVVARDHSYMASFGVTNLTTQLWVLAGLTVFIFTMESVFEYLFSVLWRTLAQTIQHELRLDAYAHVQGLEMAYFEDRSTGGLLSILNDDINQLERFLDIGVKEFVQIVTVVLLVGGSFIYFVPTLAWLAILPMPFVIWGTLYFQKLIAPHYANVREQVSVLNGQLANNLSGIATIKSFTAEAYEVEAIRRGSGAYRESNRQAIKVSSAFDPTIRMMIVIGFSAIMVFAGIQTINGTLNVGIYSVLIFLTQQLLWPLTRLGQTLDLYQRAMASSTRVLDLLKTEPQLIEGQQTLPLAQVQGAVSFENITFEYDPPPSEDQPRRAPVTLRNLTIRIPAGETVAIVGPTGSGKSTLVKLLLRLYDVQTGHICLDGQDVRTLRFRDLRQAIGFVSQDVFLFHGTVQDNIRYGTFEVEMGRVIEAAKIAEAHDFIMSLPHGYDTVVGERGQKLSGRPATAALDCPGHSKRSAHFNFG